MAVVLDTTISGTSSNGYLPVSEYVQYHENRGLDLSSVDINVIKTRIIKGTQYLDAEYTPLSGTKAVTGQSLNFPRSGATDKDGQAQPDDSIINPVKFAVCELGEYSSTGSLYPEEGRNVKRKKMDGLGEFEYQENASKKARNFPFVDSILDGIAQRNSSSVINLFRTT